MCNEQLELCVISSAPSPPNDIRAVFVDAPCPIRSRTIPKLRLKRYLECEVITHYGCIYTLTGASFCYHVFEFRRRSPSRPKQASARSTSLQPFRTICFCSCRRESSAGALKPFEYCIHQSACRPGHSVFRPERPLFVECTAPCRLWKCAILIDDIAGLPRITR